MMGARIPILNMKTQLIKGDCIEEMKKLEENSVDAIITDPPYNLSSIRKRFGKEGSAPAQFGKDGRFSRLSKGFMGKEWDNEIAFGTEIWKEALRILKPGGYLLSFGGTRTYHRLVCGIEDAGFEIRDMITWLYGSGFPKSLNIGQDFDRQECRKQLTKKLGRKPSREEFREVWKNFRRIVGQRKGQGNIPNDRGEWGLKSNEPVNITEPVTDEAKHWEGWGTALKPACEPIVVARKPLSEKSVALNVLRWGTGGMNIEECRIECDSVLDKSQDRTMIQRADGKEQGWGMKPQGKTQVLDLNKGRFPANIILDEEAGKMLDEQSGALKSGDNCIRQKEGFFFEHGGLGKKGDIQKTYGDKGGASRFFYCAKASRSERNFGLDDFKEKPRAEINKIMGNPGEFLTGSGNERTKVWKNNHPTVKPIKLMEYLIKLVTRPGAVVLDPFIGSGTTAIACLKLNRQSIGIEKEEEYIKIAEARIRPFLV